MSVEISPLEALRLGNPENLQTYIEEHGQKFLDRLSLALPLHHDLPHVENTDSDIAFINPNEKIKIKMNGKIWPEHFAQPIILQAQPLTKHLNSGGLFSQSFSKPYTLFKRCGALIK